MAPSAPRLLRLQEETGGGGGEGIHEARVAAGGSVEHGGKDGALLAASKSTEQDGTLLARSESLEMARV